MFCLIFAVSATCPPPKNKPNAASNPTPSSLFNFSQRFAKLESLKNTLENFSTRNEKQKHMTSNDESNSHSLRKRFSITEAHGFWIQKFIFIFQATCLVFRFGGWVYCLTLEELGEMLLASVTVFKKI